MLNELNQIEFHDLPIDKIAFDEFKQILIITISIFDEFTESYFSKTLEFQEVTILHFDKLLLEKQDNLEIYSFDYKYENQVFHGNIVLLLGFGKPSITIEFQCKQVHLQ